MQDDTSQAAPTKQVMWILWGALLVSQLMLIGIGHFMLFKQAQPFLDNNILMIFSASVLVLAGVSQLFYNQAKNLRNKKADSSEEKENQLQQSFTPFLLSLALGEAITISGLVMPLVGGAGLMQYSYGFFALGIGLHLCRKPR